MTTSIVSRLGRAPEEGIKAPVKAATTADITLQGSGITIDGVLINTSDRVLVKDQTLPAENGIYVAGPNAWERAPDMNKDDDVENAQYVADANRGILYQVSVTKPWSPGATPINFIPALSAMPPSITLTNSNPIDLVDVDVALKTGADDPATEPHLEFDFQAIQSKSDATTAAPLLLNPQGSYVQSPQTISGDPGFESTGITINGTLYQASDKVSDIGSANLAQLILHKHSSLYPPFFVAARAQGDTAAHVIVNDTDILYGMIACGWDGTDYAVAAEVRVTVQGTPGNDDMPGQWEWYTTPDGATNPVLRMTLDPAGNLLMTAAGIVQDIRYRDSSAAANDGNWVIRRDGTEFFLAAADDAWALTAEFLKAERDSGNGLITALAVGSTEVDQIDMTAATIINIDTPTVTYSGQIGDYNSVALVDDQILIASGGVFIVADLPTLVAATPPAAHTHVEADIIDLQAYALPGDQVTVFDGTANTILYVDNSGNVNEVALGAASQVLTSNGPAVAPSFQAGGGGSSVTVEDQIARSGSTDRFTGLAGAQWIEIRIEDYDVNSVNQIWFRPEYSGTTVQTTGYNSYCLRQDSAGNTTLSGPFTTTFSIANAAATGSWTGSIRFEKADDDTNLWTAHGTFIDTVNDELWTVSGTVLISGAINGIRINNSAATSGDTGNLFCTWGT